MIKESNGRVDDRVESSECNLPVPRPLTLSVTASFHTAAYHLCSSFCSPPLLTHQSTCVVPLLKRSSMIRCLLHPSPTLYLLCIHVSPRPWRPMFFFSAILQLSRNPFTYDGGESGPENDTPLLQGSRRSNPSALSHETGAPDDGRCKENTSRRYLR